MKTAITRARASALLLGGAALLSSRAAARAQSGAAVRVGTILLEAAAEVYFAQDVGFFAKAGLNVDIQLFENGPAIAAASVSNAIDIGYGTVDALTAIHQKNVPLVIIAPSAEYVSPDTQNTSALLVPLTSTVATGKDLTGKTVAVIALNGITHTAARAWIDQNGGDSTQVKFIEIPPPAMGAALAAGRVDAAWITEPFLTAAKRNARPLVYGFDAIGKRFLLNVWFTSGRLGARAPGSRAAFCRRHARHGDLGQRQPRQERRHRGEIYEARSGRHRHDDALVLRRATDAGAAAAGGRHFREVRQLRAVSGDRLDLYAGPLVNEAFEHPQHARQRKVVRHDGLGENGAQTGHFRAQHVGEQLIADHHRRAARRAEQPQRP